MASSIPIGGTPVTTPVSLAQGGTGGVLVDPNADRMLFWDDSAGATAFLTPGTNLSITGTTINAAGGSITVADTRVLFADGADNPVGDAGFTYDKTTDTATLAGGLTVTGAGTSAEFTTSLGVPNADLTWAALAVGQIGNVITIEYIEDSPNDPLSVSLVGTVVTVHLATDGGGVGISTATEVKDAVNLATDLVSGFDAGASDGSGVVIAMAPTLLTGGASAVTAVGPSWLDDGAIISDGFGILQTAVSLSSLKLNTRPTFFNQPSNTTYVEMTSGISGDFALIRARNDVDADARLQIDTQGSGEVDIDAHVVVGSLEALNTIKAEEFHVETLAFSETEPTIGSGFGTSPSITTANGTAAFTIDVGTGGTAQNGVIALPTAQNGWVVTCQNITNNAISVVGQTASSTTTATIQNYSRTTGLAAAWTASDILHVIAVAR